MVQKGEGIRERLRSYCLEIRSKVTPGFWKPKFVTHLSTPSEGGLRSRGREEFGDVVGDYCLGRQYLLLIDQGFDPVTIPFPVIFSHAVAKESRPQYRAFGWFDYISIVFTVIYGEIFNLVAFYLRAYFCTCCCSCLKAYQD